MMVFWREEILRTRRKNPQSKERTNNKVNAIKQRKIPSPLGKEGSSLTLVACVPKGHIDCKHIVPLMTRTEGNGNKVLLKKTFNLQSAFDPILSLVCSLHLSLSLHFTPTPQSAVYSFRLTLISFKFTDSTKYVTLLLYTRGVLLMPPRGLASGLKPCRNN